MLFFSRITIELSELEKYLKQNIQIKQICQEIIYDKIISKAATARNIVLTEEEIENEAHRQRRQMNLEKATDTFAWLNSQLITSDDWEVGLKNSLLRKKLAEALFAEEAKTFFGQNKHNFDCILLYQIIVPYEQLAWEILYQIEEQEISFYQAAHFYDIDEKRRYLCGYEGRFYRYSLSPQIAAIVFGAKVGEVISPFQTEQGYHIALVEELIKAELTENIYQEIINKMMDEWLANELIYLLHNFDEQPNRD
ncbi:peptidylprolyl isomerase [Aphanothece hegewaldii CCALA 016]|uniref:peptidylprolyl isomerase n=1 Tax=Aphanothece hegewaldii CCALA 016 TaxID=2107694 RepID=A0A2T1LRN6_9CHRO|nr:peptidylprolyl isomerase [Aphanothece hegewaldii]PSF31400.1 peptidylprolyl isomerase [Aphanothece hegewaldii CCALA 016]